MPVSNVRRKAIVAPTLTPTELRARLTEIVEGLRFATKEELYRLAVSAELTTEVTGARIPVPHAARHVMVRYNKDDPARPHVYAPAELLEFMDGQLLAHAPAHGRPEYETRLTPRARPVDE